MLKNIVPFGPPLSGKGAGSGSLKAEFGDQMFTIYTGDLIRERRKIDSEFDRTHGPAVDRGDYVPDNIIIALAEAAYKQASNDSRVRFVYWDGVFRTPEQLTHFMDRQIIRIDNTGAFCLQASKATCLDNLEHRNKRLGRSDDKPDTFKHRYDLYMKGVNVLHEMFEADGIKVAQIDANRPRDLVAKSVVLFVQEYLTHGRFISRSPEIFVSDVAGRSPRERVLRIARIRSPQLAEVQSFGK